MTLTRFCPHIWIKETPTYERNGVWTTSHCLLCRSWKTRRSTDKEAESIGVFRK